MRHQCPIVGSVPGPTISVEREPSDGDTMRKLATLVLPVVFLANASAVSAQAPIDAAGAEALMKASGCFKCHSFTAKKDGPSYKSVADKYRGKADAEDKLYTHLTTNPKIKVDGEEERHDSLKTRDSAQVRNVIRFILSR